MYHREGQHFIQGEEGEESNMVEKGNVLVVGNMVVGNMVVESNMVEKCNVLVVGNMVVEGKGEEEEGDGEKEEGEKGQLWMGTGVS